jgi:hypothetical protein
MQQHNQADLCEESVLLCEQCRAWRVPQRFALSLVGPTPTDLEAVSARLRGILADTGAHLTVHVHCPVCGDQYVQAMR